MLRCKVQSRGVTALCAYMEPISLSERRFCECDSEYYMNMGEKK